MSENPSLSDALRMLNSFLEPYKNCILISLALSSPFFNFWSTPDKSLGSLASLGAASVLFLTALILAAILEPTRSRYGPLRFAYLAYTPKLLAFVKSFPAWAGYVFFFPLPVSRLYLLLALLVAWYYIVHHYRKRLLAVTCKVEHSTARLNLILIQARRTATLAHKYEKQALAIISKTRRTASLTLTLHSTDFFDNATDAWAALGATEAATQRVDEKASDVVSHAENVLQCEPPNEGGQTEILAKILLEYAQNTRKDTGNAVRLAQEAQRTIQQSKEAREQAEKARTEVYNAARDVTNLGLEVTTIVSRVDETIRELEENVEAAKALLDGALAMAVEGEMESADSANSEATREVKKVVDGLKDLISTTGNARKNLVKLLAGTWHLSE